MEPRLSVALVTRNRPESLARTLHSLRQQSPQPWEVVVSDDSEGEERARTRAVADSFGCRYLEGPRRGLYANRNQAALACTGSHIRTMDDDHEFPPQHLARCLEALANDPDSIWIVGEFFPGQQRPGAPPCPGQLTPRGYSCTPLDPDRCWAIACGSTMYPRVIFDRGLRHSEIAFFGPLYLEWGSRLHSLGYRIRFLPTTHVIHHFDPATRSSKDLETALKAQFFAMFCHSWDYQPTWGHRTLSLLEMTKLLFLHGRTAGKALRQAHSAYRDQRAQGGS